MENENFFGNQILFENEDNWNGNENSEAPPSVMNSQTNFGSQFSNEFDYSKKQSGISDLNNTSSNSDSENVDRIVNNFNNLNLDDQKEEEKETLKGKERESQKEKEKEREVEKEKEREKENMIGIEKEKEMVKDIKNNENFEPQNYGYIPQLKELIQTPELINEDLLEHEEKKINKQQIIIQNNMNNMNGNIINMKKINRNKL